MLYELYVRRRSFVLLPELLPCIRKLGSYLVDWCLIALSAQTGYIMLSLVLEKMLLTLDEVQMLKCIRVI